MKLSLLLLISLAFIPKITAQDAAAVTRVDLKYQDDINKIITVVYTEIKSIFLDGNQVLGINVNKKDDIYEVKTGPVGKSNFGWLLRYTKATPYGYFKTNDLIVIIFGNSPEVLFKKTDETIMYSWLKPLPPLKNDNMMIEPPPPHFEPPVWLYEFSNKEFKFIDVNYYVLINDESK